MFDSGDFVGTSTRVSFLVIRTACMGANFHVQLVVA